MQYPQRNAIASALPTLFETDVTAQYLANVKNYHKKQQFVQDMSIKDKVLSFYISCHHTTAMQREQFHVLAAMQLESTAPKAATPELAEYCRILRTRISGNPTGPQVLMLRKLQHKQELHLMRVLTPTEENRAELTSFLRLFMLFADCKSVYETEEKETLQTLCDFVARKPHKPDKR